MPWPFQGAVGIRTNIPLSLASTLSTKLVEQAARSSEFHDLKGHGSVDRRSIYFFLSITQVGQPLRHTQALTARVTGNVDSSCGSGFRL